MNKPITVNNIARFLSAFIRIEDRDDRKICRELPAWNDIPSSTKFSEDELEAAQKIHPLLKRIENIDSKILAELEREECHLDMSSWHGEYADPNYCNTTHCRAGWAVHLASEGKRIRDNFGRIKYAISDASFDDDEIAGALIYAVSRPDQKIPDFFAEDEDALADIKKCARKERNAKKATVEK